MPRTLAQNAQYIANTIKPAIKLAIEAQGVTVPSTDSFLDYADRIAEIEGSGGGGKVIDISKADYSIGFGANPKVNNGRILSGFTNMSGYHARPLDASGNWLDVDWSKSFEICATFKLTAYPSASAFHFIFGCGLNSTNYRFYSPSIIFYGSDYDYKMAVQIGATSSSWLVTDMVDYALSLDTWYSIRLKFNSTTLALTIDVTTDFSTWTNVYNDTLTATPYHDSASLCFGGDCQDSARSSNNLLIDTFNTYIKDDSGSIIWGAYAGEFDDGKYPVISGEYQLYDYIESDGTQYIDTGRKINANDMVRVCYKPYSDGMDYYSSWGYIWGCYQSGAGGASGLALTSNSTKDKLDNGSTIERTSWSNGNYYEDTHTVTVSKNANIFIFCYTDANNGRSKAAIYSLSINGDYYLPCKRKADGVFGLIDITNKTFFTDSAGGNAFVGGNPIGVEV